MKAHGEYKIYITVNNEISNKLYSFTLLPLDIRYLTYNKFQVNNKENVTLISYKTYTIIKQIFTIHTIGDDIYNDYVKVTVCSRGN